MPLYYCQEGNDKFGDLGFQQLDPGVLFIQDRGDGIKFDVVPGSQRGDRKGQRNRWNVKADGRFHRRQQFDSNVRIIFDPCGSQRLGHGRIGPTEFAVGLFKEFGQDVKCVTHKEVSPK